MSPSWFEIILLSVLQGAAELLPVSSSAHVILAEKLMGLDPSAPELTFLLVMLHTGTMAAVIVYFWNAWKRSYFSNLSDFKSALPNVAVASVITLVLGYALMKVLEKLVLGGGPKAEVEQLFANLPLVGTALAAAGLLIIVAGLFARKSRTEGDDVSLFTASIVGAVQAFCLPFRGFSRSGATISTGMLLGIGRHRIEEFSFALAVIITPPAIAVELHRLLKVAPGVDKPHLGPLLFPGLVGMVCSFIAGLLALKLLSSWLENGKWHYFGFYCLAFSAVVFACAHAGY